MGVAVVALSFKYFLSVTGSAGAVTGSGESATVPVTNGDTATAVKLNVSFTLREGVWPTV